MEPTPLALASIARGVYDDTSDETREGVGLTHDTRYGFARALEPVQKRRSG